MERTANKNTDENSLLEEGILLRVKFRNNGIATLYRKDGTDSEYATTRCGEMLPYNVPGLYKLFTPEDIYNFLVLSSPEIWVRLRLCLPGTDDVDVKQSEYEPEACFPAWITKRTDGQAALFLRHPARHIYAVGGRFWFPGLSGLASEDTPVRVRRLIKTGRGTPD